MTCGQKMVGGLSNRSLRSLEIASVNCQQFLRAWEMVSRASDERRPTRAPWAQHILL